MRWGEHSGGECSQAARTGGGGGFAGSAGDGAGADELRGRSATGAEAGHASAGVWRWVSRTALRGGRARRRPARSAGGGCGIGWKIGFGRNLGPMGWFGCGPSDEARRLPQTLLVGFPGVDGEVLLMQLDLGGVDASMGSACASGSTRPSPSLEAMGVPEALAPVVGPVQPGGGDDRRRRSTRRPIGWCWRCNVCVVLSDEEWRWRGL